MKSEFEECRQGIINSIAQWKSINSHGCNDPFWTDGCNMNLVRNHIIYYKHRLEELCMQASIPLPEEYYLPIPPEAPGNYMASLKQKERVQTLMRFGYKLATKRTKYEDSQMSFV